MQTYLEFRQIVDWKTYTRPEMNINSDIPWKYLVLEFLAVVDKCSLSFQASWAGAIWSWSLVDTYRGRHRRVSDVYICC